MSPRGATASCGSRTQRPTWSVIPTVSETPELGGGGTTPGWPALSGTLGLRDHHPAAPSHHPGCTDDIVTSDHSPVFATFEVGVTSQFVPKKGKGFGSATPPRARFGVSPGHGCSAGTR